MSPIARRRWLQALFCVSGAPGLIAQLGWTRILTAGLGHEMPAVAGVISAYFVGLAAGAWWLDEGAGWSSSVPGGLS
jgi:spermidine synthase